jgi:hypothetical protein
MTRRKEKILPRGDSAEAEKPVGVNIFYRFFCVIRQKSTLNQNYLNLKLTFNLKTTFGY